jgi:hypothetical protein
MSVHHATLPLEGETTHWASLDGGDTWLPVNREPVAGDEDAIQKLFDGDGNFMPMRCGRRLLEHEGAEFHGEVES